MTDLAPNRHRIAVVDIIADSTGREVIPANCRFYGDEALVLSRIIGTKEHHQRLQTINDAAHAKRDLQALREEKAELAKRADAITEAEGLIRSLCDTVNTLTARMDAYEQQLRTKAEEEEQERNAEPVTLPPGSAADEGELQTSKAHDEHSKSEPTDGDPGAVLPRALIGPSSKLDPDLPPHPTLVESQ